MDDLIEPHEPLTDCDCAACAKHERNQLRAAITGLLKFYQEGDDGADLPREYWSPGYLEAVEIAESLVGPNVEVTGTL